ncbi:MAG TPA: extracellular solute-binding protein [Puia sp.]|uniref:ABC transporter substrate-binding protein n=1 Tax=Puia sp. TaxID=2045100 RepID=UPI002CC74AA0|nr:extracellular solute-binding protein [Puia sp.]HVU98324.1 extracellular solute-binding protein [Puia sp.]
MPSAKSNTEITIKGITWGHSRGYTPLVAAAQRFTELNPAITITWEKRSLQQFADYPIEELAKVYDLLIIDHPWAGAAHTNAVLPLEQYLPAEYLSDQAENSIGFSHQSYYYGGHQWALAIDAATPVASYRADLMKKAGAKVPGTWAEVLDLANKGRLAVPAIPIDILMNFYMFCIAHGCRPFQSQERVIDPQTGEAALDTMQELYSRIDKKFFSANPIAVAEAMTATDDYWYCPFAYGYSNYAREGYAKNKLSYTDLVAFNGHRLRSTLGGTGLAISASTNHPEAAIAFAKYVCAPKTQSTLYVEHGGQPGHKQAWLGKAANHLTDNYFFNTLPALERSYMRPRYHGYLHFQDHAGNPIQQFLQGRQDKKSTLKKVEDIYAQSLKKEPA